MAVPGSSARPDLPIAVVIGAGGIGMAVARRLGAWQRLLLVDRDGERLEQACNQLRSEGHDATPHVCDITDAEAVAQLAATVAVHGPLRTLAHVAALSPSMGDWTSLIRVNLIGLALVEQALRPLAARGTAAVLVSSLAAHGSEPSDTVTALLDAPLSPGFLPALEAEIDEAPSPHLAYRLSKFALNRLVRRRAIDWGRRGARIVSLSPGLIASPMGAREYLGSSGKMALFDAIPLQREGTMLEIADALDFLASDRASYINGTDLLVDGGLASALRFPQA